MSSHTTLSPRLSRLLRFVEFDAGNLALRKDAIHEACTNGDWDIARELVDAGLRLCADEAELLALSGFVCLQAQRYLDAERALSAALAQGLDAAEVRYNLAFALFMQQRLVDALELLQSAELMQAVPLALLLRARCFHHLRRLEEAAADCEAHLAIVPSHAETAGLLALLLYEQGRTAEAQPRAEAALRQNPKQLEALLASASMQASARDFDAALHLFKALVEAHPQCGRGWLGLALAELTHMQLDSAARHAELAAAHQPAHIGTWLVLAWARLMQGDVPGASAAFDEALAIDRNFGESHGGLAVIAAVQGREAEARLGIKRALRLDPDGWGARYAEIVLMQRAGKDEAARAALDAALARPAPNGEGQYRDLIAAQVQRLHDIPRPA